MNNHNDERWDMLKSISPGEEESNRMRNRIRSSIQNRKFPHVKAKVLELKNVVLTALFLIISASLIFQLQNHAQTTDEPGSSRTSGDSSFTWELDRIYTQKMGDAYTFFRDSKQVGSAEFITSKRKEEIIKSPAMYVEKELENFPYPTTMYIEHVKMQDVSLRYHFFVNGGKETLYLSFEYPKLEYAEIFQIIASLELKNYEPYMHQGLLYVTHGYGKLPYPVGLKPVQIMGNTEKYKWIQQSREDYRDYVEKIKSSKEWKQKEGGGSSYTFESVDGLENVKISMKGNEITYEFSYPNREE